MEKELIMHLEELARLELSEAERKKIEPQLNEVVEYFNTLNTLDTEGIEPLSHAFKLQNVMRKDECAPSLPSEKILSNTESEDGFFAVPCSVEEEG